MRFAWLFLFVAMIQSGCADIASDWDPTRERFTDAEAKSRIDQRAAHDRQLPASAKNFYIYDGGNFNGSIVYISFDCDNRKDCWVAVHSLGAPERSEFKPWAASKYAVVMDGPGFYHEKLKGDPWDVRGITEGVVSEYVQNTDRSMDYYAIDFSKNRVYYHRESGGFPTDAYRP